MSLRLELDHVSKRFTRKLLFAPVTQTITESEIIAITGENGRGKSTLLKIIANALPASVGASLWYDGDSKLDVEAIQSRIGFVAPYLELYDDLDAAEHIEFVLQVRKLQTNGEVVRQALLSTGLQEAALGRRRLRAFSSGMRQRVRVAMALAVQPSILLLDEATSNLDEQGIEYVGQSIRDFAATGGIVIMATNEPREIGWASSELRLLPSSEH